MSRQGSRHLSSLFSERLKQAQRDASVGNEELARDIGVSLRLIQKYRSGDVRPRDENLLKLARRLNRPVSWFFSENGVAA